jgi:hypothetical protein
MSLADHLLKTLKECKKERRSLIVYDQEGESRIVFPPWDYLGISRMRSVDPGEVLFISTGTDANTKYIIQLKRALSSNLVFGIHLYPGWFIVTNSNIDQIPHWASKDII